MQIERRTINQFNYPFVVAEISGNHNQDLDTAYELIRQAKKCGVDAVKFQTYKSESLTLDPELTELYKKACLPFDWHERLFDYVRSLDLIPFSSVFCEEGLELLERIGCSAYKIASFELYHRPLIEKVYETGKPIIFSDGIAQFSDLCYIDSHFSALNTAVLKCVSQYPADPKDFNLKTLRDMKLNFGFEIGISDHTLGFGVSIASLSLGATIIERHFTLDRKNCIDSAVSLEPPEMKLFVENVKQAYDALGEIRYDKKPNKYSRGLYALEDISQGEIFTEDNLGILRPDNGTNPLAYYSLLHLRVNKSYKKGDSIETDLLP